LIELLDADVIINKFWPVFVDLCKETSVDVKRHCISKFARFAVVLGPDLTEEHIVSTLDFFVTIESYFLLISLFNLIQLPVYKTLSRHCLPEIRKECVDASVTLSFLSSNKGRNEILAPLFIKFLTDQARYVSFFVSLDNTSL
jgi:hypothetical protein